MGLMGVLFSCTTSQDETTIIEKSNNLDSIIRNYSSKNGINIQLTNSILNSENTNNGFELWI